MRVVEIKINEILRDGECDRLIASIPDREWVAIRQIILRSLEDITVLVTNPDISREYGLQSFYNGAQSSLRELLAQYEVLRQKGREISKSEEV